MEILILVPTTIERSILVAEIPTLKNTQTLRLCGFGVISSAARTAQLLSERTYDLVVLTGIAGSYDITQLKIGEACCFKKVRCHGLGVGTGSHHLTASEMGWNQFEAETENTGTLDLSKPNQEEIETQGIQSLKPLTDVCTLATPQLKENHLTPVQVQDTLLTVCAASANPKEGVEKVERYPGTTAEDMEGFGVAAACHLHSVPLWIIRGISNSVGERDHDQWQVEKAMKAAAKLLEKSLSSFIENR